LFNFLSCFESSKQKAPLPWWILVDHVSNDVLFHLSVFSAMEAARTSIGMQSGFMN